ncbi:MAG: DUF2891 family protein [Myxococcales bacterium]|nr:DUF2891 family protein [Myxococcales bacterium]
MDRDSSICRRPLRAAALTGLLALSASAGCAGDDAEGSASAPTEATGTTAATGTTGTSADATESTDGATTGATATEGTSASTGATSSATETGTTTGDGESSSTTAVDDPAWDAFVDARASYLEALAAPIVACIQQEDTAHPAFHGCIDWHSAVHASYALLALYRLTGEPSYLELVDATLDPEALAGELADVEGGELPQEIPYGYAWFLTLAREREAASGDLDLVPLAGAIAGQLREWALSRSPQQLLAGGLADDYQNLSWALLNLHRWALHTGDDALRLEMEALAGEVLLDPVFDEMCPLSQEESDADDFFPPCLHRAYALVELLPAADVDAWLAGYLPDDLTLTPIVDPSAAHIAGLNFSRAWGLWALYRQTGDTAWRARYVDHVVTHVEQPAYWAEDYWKYSHWVAQFGVYAIALSYDE